MFTKNGHGTSLGVVKTAGDSKPTPKDDKPQVKSK